MLRGQAKTDYQREYMRKRRGSNKKGIGLTRSGGENVRPIEPPKQSYNPMKIGYVRPS